MKTNYKQKIFLYFIVIFALFAIGIAWLEQTHEREYKTKALEERLDNYADMIHKVLEKYPNNFSMIDSLRELFPSNIRLTLIGEQGTVFYDNVVDTVQSMENHAHRPEVLSAMKTGTGSNIRTSVTTKKEYLYYAKQFNSYYIRVALPYDIQVRHILKPDKLFLYYIIGLFVIILLLINIVSGRFGKSIRGLRDFAKSVEQENAHTSIHFPEDELGEIGAKITENYSRLKESKKAIDLERDKLMQHVLTSEEGLCFFSPNKTVEFYNGLFIQYLNTIIDEANSNPAIVFTDASFDKINSFLLHKDIEEKYFETHINKHGKTFAARVNIFDDRSFEIVLNNITKEETTRRMKQEMTGNITHELRTPVTGIRGCLETILEHQLEPDKKQYFIERAYNQVLALSEIIQDMSLITKIEEAPQSFKLEAVSISELLENLQKDLEIPMQEKNISMEWGKNMENVVVKGNHNLLYSIFRNLTDNVIRHAGTHVNIFISKYNENKDFYYFSYSDNGQGIPDEQHLNRLFERFYRITEGRTRDTGGSGLGLSIVKNAISFHKGTIVAKNKPDGGLEFLFNLPRN